MTTDERIAYLEAALALERAKVHELSAALAEAVSADAHAKRVTADRKAARSLQNRAAYSKRKQGSAQIQRAESGAETTAEFPFPSPFPPSPAPSSPYPLSFPPSSPPLSASQEPAVPPRDALALQPQAPKAKRQKFEKPADPRHAPLSLALVAAGWPHHGGRTAKALAALLAHADREPGVTDAQAEILRRAGIARAWAGFPQAREIHELEERWGHFAQPQVARGTGPPDVRRGSVRAELIDHTKPEEPF